MEELTGIRAFDWVLAAMYAVAAVLVVGSPFWRSPGTRVGGVLVLPFAVGLGGIAALALTFRAETRTFLGAVVDKGVTLVVAALVVLVSVAIADFLVSRVASLVAATRVFRRTRREGDAALAVALVLPAALAWVGIVKLDDHTISSYEASQAIASGAVTVVEEHELPSQPMDVSMQTATEGYVSFEDGSIGRLVLRGTTQTPDVSIEASGLASPRGLAIVGNSLIVADLGGLPCEPPSPCKGENVDAPSAEAGERRILRESDGRLLRFDIRRDGSLANRRVILDQIPVANSEHALNAVTAGPDGRVYITVGNLDRLATVPLTKAERTRPHFDWLGTVLSLRPDGSDVRVVARGIRNIYDLTFDPRGRLYGADNDGKTRAGWRREEVLEIHDGAYYGYPAEGTFAPYVRPRAPGLWVLDTVGSAGVEWVRWDGRPTLVVGSCDDVEAVELHEVDGAVAVTDRADVRHVLAVAGCVTVVEQLPGQRLLLGIYAFGEPGRIDTVRRQP